jgi:hypothetical protein
MVDTKKAPQSGSFLIRGMHKIIDYEMKIFLIIAVLMAPAARAKPAGTNSYSSRDE